MLTSAHRSQLQRGGTGPAPDEAQALASFLGPGVRTHGVLEIDGELVVSGLVRGQIMAQRLVIATNGHVEGDIIAGEVVIAGRLDGRVFSPSVTIEASAEVEGRIFHTQVTVARGARVSARMPWRPESYFEKLDKLPEIRP
jgi:cytoskeletal protein CcmA (bactofilin family)